MARRVPAWTRKRLATTICPRRQVAAPYADGLNPVAGTRRQWTGAVRVSIEEAATLQGFRRDYPWQGSRTRCFLQIGNAVCPLVARRVVEAASRPTFDRRGCRR